MKNEKYDSSSGYSTVTSSGFVDGCSFSSSFGSLLPHFNRVYFHSSRQAFNMAQFLVAELHFDDSVFHTALHYWHRFVEVHGLRSMNDVLLVTASVFLAAKVAHYKFSARKLIILAFDLGSENTGSRSGSSASPNSTSSSIGKKETEEELDLWRQALLDTELILCDTLQFHFHIADPIRQMEDILVLAAEKEGLSSSSCIALSTNTVEVGQEVGDIQEGCSTERISVPILKARVRRLHIFLLISPLQTCVTAEERSLALLLIVIRYSLLCPTTRTRSSSSTSPIGGDDALTGVHFPNQWLKFAERVIKLAYARFGEKKRSRESGQKEDENAEGYPLRPQFSTSSFQTELVEGVLGVIVETFSLMKKSTHILSLDELIAAHTAREAGHQS